MTQIDKTIVVHCPPRTGSYSLLVLVRRASGIRSLHVHYLMNKYYYWDKVSARNSIELNGKDNYKIACTVRDPIARNLSEYWRRWQIDANKKGLTRGSAKLGLRRMAGTHQEKFDAYIDHFRQHHFFGSELIPYWGIDIFRQPFTPPYTIYDGRLLMIRCEDLDGHAAQAVSEWLGIEVTQKIKHLNRVPVKRELIWLSEIYIDAMYDEREIFPRWFYSDEEIDGFKEKWMSHGRIA